MLEEDVTTIAAGLGVEVAALRGRDRPAALATARAITYRLLLERGHAGPDIAAYFGRDHSTIYQMRERAVMRSVASTSVRAMTHRAREALRAGPGRVCSSCEKAKPESDYYPRRPTICKACVLADSRKRQQAKKHADPEAFRAAKRAYQQTYRQRKREAVTND